MYWLQPNEDTKLPTKVYILQRIPVWILPVNCDRHLTCTVTANDNEVNKLYQEQKEFRQKADVATGHVTKISLFTCRSWSRLVAVDIRVVNQRRQILKRNVVLHTMKAPNKTDSIEDWIIVWISLLVKIVDNILHVDRHHVCYMFVHRFESMSRRLKNCHHCYYCKHLSMVLLGR